MRLLSDPEQAMLGLLRQFLWAAPDPAIFVVCEDGVPHAARVMAEAIISAERAISLRTEPLRFPEVAAIPILPAWSLAAASGL